MKSSLVLESIWQKWRNLTLSMDGFEMKQKLMDIILPLTEKFYTEGLCINTLSKITNLKLDLMNGVLSKMDWISFGNKTLSTVLLIDRYTYNQKAPLIKSIFHLNNFCLPKTCAQKPIQYPNSEPECLFQTVLENRFCDNDDACASYNLWAR